MSRPAELLVDCPFCGRTGFTVRGLRLHWCPGKTGRTKRSISKAEWQAAVAKAKERAR